MRMLACYRCRLTKYCQCTFVVAVLFYRLQEPVPVRVVAAVDGVAAFHAASGAVGAGGAVGAVGVAVAVAF